MEDVRIPLEGDRYEMGGLLWEVQTVHHVTADIQEVPQFYDKTPEQRLQRSVSHRRLETHYRKL